MVWEVLTRELIVNDPTLVIMLGKLLLLVPNTILDDFGINRHREVVSSIREVVQA
jgi:hypothetical protein